MGSISTETFAYVKKTYAALVTDVLGLREEKPVQTNDLLEVLLGFYKEAKAAKDYARVDQIRAEFKKQRIVIKDMKNGIDWAYEE